MLIDYLHRGSPKVIAIDFTFAEPNSGVTFMLAGERWTGEESDQALADSVKAAGNVIMLADATYESTVERDQANQPANWRADPIGWDRQSRSGRSCCPRSRRSQMRRTASATASCRSTMARRGGFRHSSEAGTSICRRSAWPRR